MPKLKADTRLLRLASLGTRLRRRSRRKTSSAVPTHPLEAHNAATRPAPPPEDNTTPSPFAITSKGLTHLCSRYAASLPNGTARRGAGTRNVSSSIPPSKPTSPARKPVSEAVLNRGERGTVGESMPL